MPLLHGFDDIVVVVLFNGLTCSFESDRSANDYNLKCCKSRHAHITIGLLILCNSASSLALADFACCKAFANNSHESTCVLLTETSARGCPPRYSALRACPPRCHSNSFGCFRPATSQLPSMYSSWKAGGGWTDWALTGVPTWMKQHTRSNCFSPPWLPRAWASSGLLAALLRKKCLTTFQQSPLLKS